MIFSVAIIGLGRAGGRFLRAFLHRQQNIGDVRITAVCDPNPARAEILRRHGIKTYNDVRELLKAGKYDIIVIATNEDSHFQILSLISGTGVSFRRIIMEKPLVETMEQAGLIKKMFTETDIAVHFVERHSPIVNNFLDWKAENGLEINRAAFFWGKYRLHDSRPTIGVTTEISHALDCVAMLAGISPGTPFEILQGSYIRSDFSFSGSALLDTINMTVRFGGNLIIDGNSSFLWEKRERRIILYLSNHEHLVTHMAALIFDNPYWDLDTCVINKADSMEGIPKLVRKWKVLRKDIDPNTFCISKTLQFLEENVSELKGGPESPRLARLGQACYIQEILEALIKDASRSDVNTSIFGASDVKPLQWAETEMLLGHYLAGNYTVSDVVKWDSGY